MNLQSFEIPGVLRCEPGNGGLTKIVVRSVLAEADIYLHGAHVTHFQPRGHKPILFLSSKSFFETGKPIRGGVPICFPWFAFRNGDPTSTLHGFVRLYDWSIESVQQTPEGAVSVVLTCTDTEQTRATWPCKFLARYTVTIGQTLGLSLQITNTDTRTFQFEEALHTYYAVGDVEQITIRGLEVAEYISKSEGMVRKRQGVEPIRILQSTDRVYQNTQNTVTIEDPVEKRTITVAKQGSRTTVVWCPYKSNDVKDLGLDEWRRMVCVETCNAGENTLTLAAGQSSTMSATISVENT